MSDPMTKALDMLGKKESKMTARMRKMNDGKVYVEHSYEGGSEAKDKEEYAHDQKGLHEHIDKHFFGAADKPEKGTDWEKNRSDKEALPKGTPREADGAK